MTRLLSVAVLAASCLWTYSLRAEIGCSVSCGSVCASGCDACAPRCKRSGGLLQHCGLRAHGGWLKRKSCCENPCGGCFESGCDCGSGGWKLRGQGCGHFGHRHCIDGLDRYANCGCNGSYNYPVPPLYTYHWPGMYKAQRMTDYHSPWRFPPLRPYTEEKLAPLIEETPAPSTMTMAPIVHLRPLAADYPVEGTIQAAAGEVESVSSRLQRMNAR